MAITIISAQLNTWGGNGTFEPDRSTWVFGDPINKTITRTLSEKVSGLYSALIHNADIAISASTGVFCRVPVPTGSVGKKFFLRAKVRVPTSSPFAADGDVISFDTDNTAYYTFDPAFVVTKTILDAKDTWVEISTVLTVISDIFLFYFPFQINVSGTHITGGDLYVDDYEVYECLTSEDGGPDPEPEPEPDETDLVYHSKNPITLSKTAASGWDLLTNYRLYNDIRVEDESDSGTYISKLKVELPPDSNGHVVFYLNEAFRDAFTFVPPILNQNTIVRLTDRIKRFKCFTGELTGLDTTPGALTEGDPGLVLFGGINKFKWPTLEYFTSYVSANKKFLTWAPVEKYVDRLQEDYLNFWIYDAAIATLKLQIKAYFDDDTNETAISTTLEPVTYKALYRIPAGPANSGAALVNPAKNLVKYELTLLDQDGELISEVRTYYVSLVRHPLTRFFMFLDSLGTDQVLRFTGQASEETTYDRIIVQKFLPHNYEASVGEFAINNNIMSQKNSFSSGYIKNRMAEEWHEQMKDFLLSSRVYDVTNGQRLPIVITGGTHVKEDQNYERFIRFEAKPAYDDQSFTPSSI